ncbi:MAG: hypothetical protein VYA60_04540 [Pseudomonadota bacterium]|nr:hypothetical protein [Pseudomonadota bacterium]
MDCWRVGQVKHEDFLSDVNLINKFIDIQKSENPDFLVEVFLEPEPRKMGGYGDLSGTVNLIVRGGLEDKQKPNHTGGDVLSLNASFAMTGYCPANQKAKSNTRLYNSIATSNMMGAWGFMNEAIEQLWWILPTDWDGLDSKTKQIYINNYKQGGSENE